MDTSKTQNSKLVYFQDIFKKFFQDSHTMEKMKNSIAGCNAALEDAQMEAQELFCLECTIKRKQVKASDVITCICAAPAMTRSMQRRAKNSLVCSAVAESRFY
jgi:hypothetical protein